MAYVNQNGQVRVGVRGWVPVFGPDEPGTPITIDEDSIKFIQVSGISDSVQTSAIETLVSDLKAYGLWTKMKAIYPFVGGSAASHKWNLKDPRDLDSAYRLVFNGGWTHTGTGAQPNGTTGYADTKLNTSILSITNTSYSIYLRTVTSTAYTWPMDLGVFTADYNGRYGLGYISQDGNSYFDVYNRTTIVNTNLNTGFIQYSRTSSSLSKVYYKNTTINSNTNNVSSYSNPNNTIYLGALHLGSGLDSYSNREQAFISIGDGLTDAEASNLFTSIQKFQTTLGRHVGTPYVSDPDAIAFLMSAGITDGTQAAAINTLVIRMKADGVWTKMRAIYPFVGGTATSHKWNLKDPRDLDAAYRLVFSGGWTHTSTGAQPNGTNGYAETYLNPAVVFTDFKNNGHLSLYSRTENPIGPGWNIGVGNAEQTGDPLYGLSIKRPSWNGYTNPIMYDFGNYTGNGRMLLVGSDARGFWIGSTTTSNSHRFYKDGSIFTSNTNVASGNISNASFHIGKINNTSGSTFYGLNNELSIVSIGDGLTDTESTNLYKSVQAYQTTLGRQVNVPLVSDTDAQSFLNAANITSFQQASAVNKLVVDLKAAGIWSKMKAIYPFVGGSAASHKFNLKDPRDLDAAFRLVFSGGGTHTSTGYLGNGSNSYARTYITHNTLSQNNTHVSFYNRYNSTSNYNNFIGCIDYPGTSNGIGIYPTNQNNFYMLVNSIEILVNIGHTSVNKFWMINRNSSTQEKVFINGSLSATINKNSQTGTSKEIYLGSINGYGNAGINESAFASIGDGLTDAESTALYTAVQTYQTSLGRAVDTPVYNNGLVLNLDAGNANSYPGTGTTWFDLAAGNNGTLTNGPTYDTTNGGSIVFDGVNDYVVTNDTSFRFGNKFTMNLWFYWDGLNKTNNSLLSKRMGSAGNYNQYAMGISNGDTQYGGTGKVLFFYARVDGSTGGNDPFDVSITYTLPTAGFYNACIVMDTNSQKLYVNGILVGSNSKNLSGKTYNIAGRELILGAARGENATDLIAYASTKMYRFSVYSYSLTETEVISNFNSTRGRFGL